MAFIRCSRVLILAAASFAACGADDDAPGGVDGGSDPAATSPLVGRWVQESDATRSALEFDEDGVYVEWRDGDEIARGSFRASGYLLELDQPTGGGTVSREQLRFHVVAGEALGLRAFVPSGERGEGLVGTWLGESSTTAVDGDGVVEGSGERVRLSLRIDGTFKSYLSAYRLERQDGELVEIPGEERVDQGTWEAGETDLRLALDGGGSMHLGVLEGGAALSPVVYDRAK